MIWLRFLWWCGVSFVIHKKSIKYMTHVNSKDSMKDVIENFINIKKELNEIFAKLKKELQLMAPAQRWSFALRVYALYAATVILSVHVLFGLGMALAFMLFMCALFVVVSFYASKDIRLYNYMSPKKKERVAFRNSTLFMAAIFLPVGAAFASSTGAVTMFTTLFIGFSFILSYTFLYKDKILSRSRDVLSTISGYHVKDINVEIEQEPTKYL